jgi:hypothetical protein
MKNTEKRGLKDGDPVALAAWIVLVLAGLTVFLVRYYHEHPSPPDPPEPCMDSMHIVESGYGYTCPPGTKQTIEAHAGTDTAIVTCTCGKP